MSEGMQRRLAAIVSADVPGERLGSTIPPEPPRRLKVGLGGNFVEPQDTGASSP